MVIKNIIKKYNSIIMYGIFGVVTVCVNTLLYFVLYKFVGLSNIISVVIAWVGAVIFAFITNKSFVFYSEYSDVRILLYELFTFLGFRIATGIIDTGIMYISVDVLGLNSIVWKTISNLFVIIINYIASKWIIFRRNEKRNKKDK